MSLILPRLEESVIPASDTRVSILRGTLPVYVPNYRLSNRPLFVTKD